MSVLFLTLRIGHWESKEHKSLKDLSKLSAPSCSQIDSSIQEPGDRLMLLVKVEWQLRMGLPPQTMNLVDQTNQLLLQRSIWSNPKFNRVSPLIHPRLIFAVVQCALWVSGLNMN
ncbi:unnamed protein product [Linum tenue]|uniref:Uncharacterized protein n=1 Tax=Linum tenue TaxID=586396 RepID=A0AAV0JAT4_9ROSI|nr:unnamed protein product [Linum tenue]